MNLKLTYQINIEHQEKNRLQTLNTKKTKKSLRSKNIYLYNGKELDTDFGLNWYHYGFRMYDAILGRFPSIDPKAEEFSFVSPYNYAENSPVANIDLWGLQKVFFQTGLEKNESFQKAYRAQRMTSYGKLFSKKLNTQKKYNILYNVHNYLYVDGAVNEITSIKEFERVKKTVGQLKKLSTNDVKKSLEDGKRLLIISIEDTPNTREGVYESAIILNHEEGAHALDYIDDGENNHSSDEDHNRYYGVTNSSAGISPNDSDVEKNPKYRNSPAKKNCRKNVLETSK